MFQFNHFNFNVLNLEKSLKFYKETLGLDVVREKDASDGSFKIVYLGALTADDFDKAHALHEKMGCICFENHDMGIYFINDPDGYWIEIIPAK